MKRPLLAALGEIARRIDRAPYLALAVGFDGTLAPLLEQPAGGRLTPRLQQALRVLASLPTVTTMIFSGRERADLQERIGIPGLYYAGNHGLEISGAGVLFIEPTASERCATLHTLASTLTEQVRHLQGVVVEDKGLTLTVHYRDLSSERHEELRRIVHSTLAGSNHPFVLTTGDAVYDIRPRVYWNKGDAVRWLLKNLERESALVLYLGDDATDEDAFTVLADDITIRVDGGAETTAQFELDNFAEVEEFLSWLADHLKIERAVKALSAAMAPGVGMD